MKPITIINSFNVKDNYLNLSYEIKNFNNGMEAAYYIYKNNSKIETIWYKECSPSNLFKYKVSGNGIYHIKIFVKYGNNIELESSKKIEVKILSNIANKICKNEKIFYLDEEVRYILEENNSEKLMIIFSGISKAEYEGGRPLYNYVRKLEDIKMNKLFILDDYNGEFCYYMGRDGRHDFERSVISLITQISNRLNISSKNTILLGSSKGGTAALYYGIKYNYGTVFCGAPQVFVADYLKEVSNKFPRIVEVFDGMLGNEKEKNYQKLNSYILDLVNSKKFFPDLFFHVGSGDKHYSNHIKPLLNLLDDKNVKYNLDVQEYNNHGETGTYFSKYVVDKLI